MLFPGDVRRGEDPQLIRDTIEGLSPDVLTIGFARRFATYKRSSLFLRDFERIKRIVRLRHVDSLILFHALPGGRGNAL